MRRPSVFAQRRSATDVKMTPMIDVVFLLLVFFVWTASFQIVEQILPSALSAQSGTQQPDDLTPPPPEKDFPDVVVQISWDGSQPNWQVNGVVISSLDELRGQLQQIAEIKVDAPLIIDPEKNVPLGHVIDVFDSSRLVGFQQVQLAASEAFP